jgi:hypothetical protein
MLKNISRLSPISNTPGAEPASSAGHADEDYLTKTGAVNLRQWLQDYWRGHPTVQFYIEEKLVPGRGTVFIVRSNLIRGLPPP